jgi:hypothetical protein
MATPADFHRHLSLTILARCRGLTVNTNPR